MNLLYVDCCISQRGKDSRTQALCQAFLSAYRQAHPQDTITTVDVATLDITPFTATMADKRSALHSANCQDDPMFDLAHQFADADVIVVGAPFWDLTFPAQLRIYIEHICANGVAYYYDAQGCHGKCKASSLTYLSSGGDFLQPNNLAIAYWEALCQMFGIDSFASVFAGGLDIDPSQAPTLLSQACQQATTLAQLL